MPTPVQWSPVFDVNGSAGGASEGQVTILANGDIVAVWKQATPGGDFDIFMRHFDASGQPKGEAVQVNVTDLEWQEKPVVTALANGGFAIAWVDHQVGAPMFDTVSMIQTGIRRATTEMYMEVSRMVRTNVPNDHRNGLRVCDRVRWE